MSSKVLIINKLFSNNKMLAINKVSDANGNNELIEKLVEPKTRKLLKSQKLFKLGKPQNKKLVQSKKLLKSENSTKFAIKKARPDFLTYNAKPAFNYLWITFTKALIL